MKKRYATEQDILNKIALERKRNEDYLKQAEVLEAEIQTMKDNPNAVSLVGSYRQEINRLHRVCSNIIELRLPKLKNKLSQIRTPQLAAIDNGDPSIPVA